MNQRIIGNILGIVFIIGILVIGFITNYSPDYPKRLDCSKQPDVYYLTPNEKDSIQPILNSNENALVVIPETNEIRANSVLLTCPNIDLMQYIGGWKW